MHLKNDYLEVGIDAIGGELSFIRDKENQYLWQGDENYWKSRAINLFPIVGRLQDEEYTYQNNSYKINRHGFLRNANMEEIIESATCGKMTLVDNPGTYAIYPFHFCYEIQYELKERSLHITYQITNKDEKEMIFGFGAHPGFNVPIIKDETFEEYQVRFLNPGNTERLLLSDNGLMSGEKEVYPLGENNTISLHHDLFDHDVVLLIHSGNTVLLENKNNKSPKIKLEYPDCPYFGIWHSPGKDAPFLCLEPWATLPGREGIREDLETMPTMLHLSPNETYTNRLIITIE